jgi:hypothetical protein
VGELFFGDERRPPISSEVFPDVQEVRDDVARIVHKYEGEELISQFVSYHMAGLVEVIFEIDPNPIRIEHLKPEQVELLKMLAPKPVSPSDSEG